MYVVCVFCCWYWVLLNPGVLNHDHKLYKAKGFCKFEQSCLAEIPERLYFEQGQGSGWITSSLRANINAMSHLQGVFLKSTLSLQVKIFSPT